MNLLNLFSHTQKSQASLEEKKKMDKALNLEDTTLAI